MVDLKIAREGIGKIAPNATGRGTNKGREPLFLYSEKAARVCRPLASMARGKLYRLTALPPYRLYRRPAVPPYRLARPMHSPFSSRGRAAQRGEFRGRAMSRVARLELGGISRDGRCER